MSANDAGFKAIRDSYAFFLNTNYAMCQPGYVEDSGQSEGTKLPTIDEFIQVVPFEAYDRSFLDPIAPSQPDRVSSTSSPNSYEPAMLPGKFTTGADGNDKSGAYWLDPAAVLTATVNDELDVSTQAELNDTREVFNLKRIAVVVKFDRLLGTVNRLRTEHSVGPDARVELQRAGRAILLRDLGRKLINGDREAVSASTIYYPVGLQGLYDGTFAPDVTSPVDRQVIKCTVSPITSTSDTDACGNMLAAVRQTMRRVSPSHDGMGAGPNALLMSWRARDLLIRCERRQGYQPMFLPDSQTGGLRYHFDGVPVYIAPVREDESGSGNVPTFAESPTSTYPFTSIYALRLGGPTGVRVLHYGGTTADKGVQTETLAEQTQDLAIGYRLTGYYTLFVPERQAVARLWNVGIAVEAL